MSLKKDFINEVKVNKKKILMGLQIDLNYYDWYLKENSELETREALEKARKALEEEQNKVVKDANNKVIANNQDMAKIAECTKELQIQDAAVNQIMKMKGEQKNAEFGYKNLMEYYNLLVPLSEEIESKLDEIERL